MAPDRPDILDARLLAKNLRAFRPTDTLAEETAFLGDAAIAGSLYVATTEIWRDNRRARVKLHSQIRA